MTITHTPSNFTAAFGEVTYTLSGTNNGEMVDIHTINSDTNTTLGIKRFANASSIDINISNYLRREFSPAPLSPNTSSRISLNSGCGVSAHISCGSTTSSERLFIPAIVSQESYTILSNSLEREIRLGESDEVSFTAPSGVQIVATIKGNGSTSLQQIRATTSQCGIWTLILNASSAVSHASSPSSIRSLTISITVGSHTLPSVHYTIVPTSQNTARLCWLNTLGAIEYHTFSQQQDATLKVSKQQILTEDSYVTVHTTSQWNTTLRSDYFPRKRVESLAEIICSPMVWRSTESGFQRVDITSDSAIVHRHDLSALTITTRNISPTTHQNI